jgi:hypothetical protein
VKCPNALQCREDSISSVLHPPGSQGNTSRRSSVFEKNPVFHYRHGSGKTACNCPDARATPSGHDLNMETRETLMERRLYSSPSGHSLEKSELVAI